MMWPWSRNQPERLPQHDFSDQVADTAATFVEFARTKGYSLDHAESSIETVETLLAELSQDTTLSSEQRASIVRECAFYVLDVAHRQFGGTYKIYPERGKIILVVGEPEFRAAFMAHDKIEGRLNGDKEDNIPFHYQGLREAVESKTTVFYV